MSETQVPSVPAAEHLVRWIECSGESGSIDAKGPMTWDGGEQSASLAKDIAAFSNSTDGGVIVIGKKENSPGTFEYIGLTEDQASSFETTEVAKWVNNRFSPPIVLACHRHEREGKAYVVITVQEFHEIPAFCIKSFPDPSNPKKLLLREGAIYIRNQNAESKPVGTVEEWRALIGLATKKRGNEFLSMFNAMLKGKPLREQSSDEEQFSKELSRVWDDLGLNQPEKKAKGAFWMSFSPGSYNPKRWPEPELLEELMNKHSIRVYHSFPANQSGNHVMRWGIVNDLHRETWAITYSGLFAFHREFYENDEVGKGPYIGDDDTPAGEWVSYQWSMSALIEFFMFMARFADAYEPGETIRYELVVGPLQGKILLSVSPQVRISYGESQPCREKEYHYPGRITVEELRTSWEDHCVNAMKELYQLFPSVRWIRDVKTLRKYVEDFKERRF